jgi:hypothetical protein
MDKFPENFNLSECRTQMSQHQSELLKEARKQIYDKIKDGINKCCKKVDIIFPKNLWYKHRKTLADELLKRFGEITIITLQGNAKVTRMTDNIDDVQNIEEIIIEFCEH